MKKRNKCNFHKTMLKFVHKCLKNIMNMILFEMLSEKRTFKPYMSILLCLRAFRKIIYMRESFN